MSRKIQLKFSYCILKDAQLAFSIFTSISPDRLPALYNVVSLPMFLLTESLK